MKMQVKMHFWTVSCSIGLNFELFNLKFKSWTDSIILANTYIASHGKVCSNKKIEHLLASIAESSSIKTTMGSKTLWCRINIQFFMRNYDHEEKKLFSM